MRWASLFGFVSLLFGQATSADSPPKVHYSERLQVSSRAQLDKLLSAHFDAGTGHPDTISNCVDFLKPAARELVVKLPANEMMAAKSTLAQCLVWSEMRRAVPPRISHLRGLVWDALVLPLLPPALAISVSHEAERAASLAAQRGKTWIDVDKSIKAEDKGTDQITVSGNGFEQRLILWGRGDFTGNGVESLLVQSLDTLTEGTYRNTRLFVLSRKTARGRLSVMRVLL